MCGRARQVIDWYELKIKWWLGQPALNLQPRWNAAPRQSLLVIRAKDRAAAEGAEATTMNWGYVPAWEKDAKGGRRPINARAENISSGMWRDPFRHRRALFPVRGFYEWQARDGRKLPFSIDRTDGAVMYLAALWDRWVDPNAPEPLQSFAVMTTTPNATVAPIHDRMPVIVPESAIAAWLYGTPTQAAALL